MLIALVLILLFLDSAIKMIQALVNGMMRKETMREEGMAITATIIADLETAGRARLEAGPVAVVHTGASIMAVEATTEEVEVEVGVAPATEVARTGPTEMTEAGLAAVVSAGEVVAAVGAAVVTEMAQAGAEEMAEAALAASATTEKVEAVVATEMARTGVVEMTEAGLAAKVMKEEAGASMAGAGEATRNQNQRNQKGK